MEKLYLLTGICANIGILYGIYRLDRAIRIMDCVDSGHYLKELDGSKIQNVLEDDMKEDTHIEEDKEEKREEKREEEEEEKREEEEDERRGSEDSREGRIEERLRRMSDESDDGVGVWAKYISFGVK